MDNIKLHSLLDKVLIKISGEYLAGKQGFGIDPSILSNLAHNIGLISKDKNRQISIVIGGGNFFEVYQLLLREWIGLLLIIWV